MQLFTAEAFLLDVTDLQERDRLVTFLTREKGKKRGVARAARRKYSRFAGQLQPLAKVSVTWVERPGRDLVRISGVDLLRPARPLMDELEGILLGGYLAEHLSTFVQEDEDAERPFRLLEATLEALLAGADAETVARYFETWVLRLAGIFPPPVECPQCGRPFALKAILAGTTEESAGAGSRAVLPPHGDSLLCRDCGGVRGLAVGGEVLAFLLLSSQRGPAEMARQPPPAAILRRVEDLCAEIRRRFLGNELRSYRVLRRTREELEGL